MRYLGLIGLLVCLCSSHAQAQGIVRRASAADLATETPAPDRYRPPADLSFVQIQLESQGRRSGDGPFTMTITGDGTVIYIPSRFDRGWILGPQTYHIPPEQVAAMLDLADKADFWSLRDSYRPTPYPEDSHFPGINALSEDVYRQVTISSDDRVKSLRLYDSGRGGNGASDAANELIYRIAELARIRLWHGFSSDTVAQLAQNGFDFRSKRGGELLIDMTMSQANSDADIERLLSLGAPADYVNTGRYLFETSLLDAAIDSARDRFVDKLITGGALVTDGQPDAHKTTRALAHAVAEASPAMTTRLMALHPELVFRFTDTNGTVQSVPVITLVGQNRGSLSGEENSDGRFHDLTAVTRQLIDAGADINDSGTEQVSLLDNAVHEDDIRFVTWLLAHGALATDATFLPFIGDDMTVLLLGTQPQLDDETWRMIVANAEPKTAVWLKAHGKWPAQ